MSAPHLPDHLGKENSTGKSFNYQLEFLKLEFDSINKTIARIDDIAGKVKNWAIVTWAGGIALSLGHKELTKYILLTGIVPILFYYVDAWWRRIQRSFIFRVNKISEFLNDQRLLQSFEQQRLIDFRLLDVRSKHHANTKEYQVFTSVWRTRRFRELSVFYVGLTLISVGLWISVTYLHW